MELQVITHKWPYQWSLCDSSFRLFAMYVSVWVFGGGGAFHTTLPKMMEHLFFFLLLEGGACVDRYIQLCNNVLTFVYQHIEIPYKYTHSYCKYVFSISIF